MEKKLNNSYRKVKKEEIFTLAFRFFLIVYFFFGYRFTLRQNQAAFVVVGVDSPS